MPKQKKDCPHQTQCKLFHPCSFPSSFCSSSSTTYHILMHLSLVMVFKPYLIFASLCIYHYHSLSIYVSMFMGHFGGEGFGDKVEETSVTNEFPLVSCQVDGLVLTSEDVKALGTLAIGRSGEERLMRTIENLKTNMFSTKWLF